MVIIMVNCTTLVIVVPMFTIQAVAPILSLSHSKKDVERRLLWPPLVEVVKCNIAVVRVSTMED